MRRAENRIDSNELGIDDIVIHNVDMLRLERMNENSFWLRLYCYDGKNHVFWISAESLITTTHEEDNG